jgi:hypothetical protein
LQLIDRLRKRLQGAARGVLTTVPPVAGTAPSSGHDVRARLLAISGKGIETREDDGDVVVCWAAKVASVDGGGADYEYLYRAIQVSLDGDSRTARGVCLSTSSEGELDSGGLSFSKSWRRGQEIGFEELHVLAWLGPHRTEGGASEEGYRFSWSMLRDPVITAVTGAGWTYRPQRV